MMVFARKNFCWTAECGVWVCETCARPYYPMELDNEDDGNDNCPDCLTPCRRATKEELATAQSYEVYVDDTQPFNNIVADRALIFCRALLAEVPELEGLAVVPSYKTPNPNLPFGFVIGRQGPLRSPDELLHMALNIHSTLASVVYNIFDVIKNCDRIMGDMAAEIKRLDAELAAKTELTRADTRTSDGVG